MLTIVPTLYDRHLPVTLPIWRDIFLITSGSLLVAIFAQIAIPLPFTPVPMTGQTFAVLLVGAALGSKRGAASLGLYTLEGALGLPVFAAARSGLTSATAGYLFGFVAAAYIIGLLAEHGLDRSWRTSLVPFFIGSIVIYLFGATWLGVYLHLDIFHTLQLGVVPFLPGDVLKMAAAALALPAAWKMVQ
jgi:biotin transport system substrate-specific component